MDALGHAIRSHYKVFWGKRWNGHRMGEDRFLKARALVGIRRIQIGQCINHAIAGEYIQH